MNQRTKEAIEQSLLTLIKSFLDSDPKEKLLKFMTEENEKSRRHEMEMMKLMFSQPYPFPRTFFINTFSFPQSFFNWKFISFSANTSLEKEKETQRIRILHTICCKHQPLHHIILYGLPIKEIFTGKQWMFYQSYTISMKWKTARKTNAWNLFKAFVLLLTCSK